ncbi:MAG: hypothetical protein ACD_4C00066G0002 [uncultured bacterium (gcode 4)]|uniref:NAD(P)-binding domain-containing protein n=1 Tax=uncultured bacterium (gcode 4) TaxID=1234023 RepID=K2F7E8_9BACT|nr:MAG: hypothetical protein ACD_4C00066G0002 [uncultured bacterium (gcode 4)]
MIQNFYKWKKILITGSTWFKWSWLSFWLHNIWAEVIWYGLEPNTNPNLFKALKLDEKITQIIWDINDIKSLEEAVDKYKPGIIFHLAAQPLVRESYKNPVYTMITNSIGTVNVLEMIRLKEYIKWAVMITTDKVYENKEWIYPYRENDRLGWFDPYSSSKAMAEIAIESYRKSFFKNHKKVAVTRAGNVIGWWDWWDDRLLPDIIKAMMKWEKLTLRNPNAVRPWQYVLDALCWYLILWEKMFEDDKYCGAYNFWPDIGDNLKVIDLVAASIKILKKWEYEIDESANKWMHEAGLLLLDNTKAKTFLKWIPKYNVWETLERTLNWYNVYYNQADKIEELSLNEINNFKL